MLRRQVYEKEETLRLNDVVEFVGIKSTVPELATFGLGQADEATAMDFMEEEIAAKPPTSLVELLFLGMT